MFVPRISTDRSVSNNNLPLDLQTQSLLDSSTRNKNFIFSSKSVPLTIFCRRYHHCPSETRTQSHFLHPYPGTDTQSYLTKPLESTAFCLHCLYPHYLFLDSCINFSPVFLPLSLSFPIPLQELLQVSLP